MSAIYLTEDDVTWLLDMETAIECVEESFRQWSFGKADNQPRRRVNAGKVTLHTLPAAAEYLGYVGVKSYVSSRAGARFQFTLYDAQTAQPVSLIEANLLGQMRTGAVSGVATKYMARPDASVVGCFGTGLQARSQLKAICCVRRIERIDVYGRDDARRRAFADEIAEFCGVPTVAVHVPEEAAAEKDVVVCATTSKVPVFDGHVLSEGTHVNAIGSNYLTKAEIDVTTIRRADHIICDSIDACQLEAGDFVPALEDGSLDWSRIHELADVVVDRETGRAHPEDITLFKSVGLGLEDLAVAVRIFERAREEGVGRPLPY
ncbi:ornithine cyclodeaminase family protein [Schlesneria paludicola]|uniref:ornithine cyclodeaminase family protein n=1 Tax=Schlesneria paludicola TaxID=360056 RepID=UPI000299EE3D|nr:ornithine cyclodeaminase family protein [Schlesneria paludicola]